MPRTGSRVIALAISTAVIFSTALTATASGGWPRLVFVDAVFEGDGGIVTGLDYPTSIAISPDGKHVYVTSYNDASVSAFSRDAATGRLAFVEVEQNGVGLTQGLAGAKHATISPDGNHVYVAGEIDHAVAVFSRNSATGALTWLDMQQDLVGIVYGLQSPTAVAVSPDGMNLYVSCWTSKTVATFLRNPANGLLLFTGVMEDGQSGVDGLEGATDVRVSPDGKHLYAAGSSENKVSAFSRNPANGVLTFLDVVEDGVGFVDGLEGVVSIALSPDGTHLYAAAIHEAAVASFARDPSTGGLSFSEVIRDGTGNVEGLDSPSEVAVSADGKHVYVASIGDDTLTAFVRDDTTGRLTFLDAVTDGVGGVDGLEETRFAAVSPDSRHVYALGRSDDAIAAFLLTSVGFFVADLPEAR
jgi:6-phosphogluconolactonase (cycloisomerase 2 family)